MDYRRLTTAERRLLKNGGRVFLVTKQNCLIILQKGRKPYYLPDNENIPLQFDSQQDALDWAAIIAWLGGDRP